MSVKERYDSVAALYQTSKKLLFRKYVEEFTIFHALGDVKGKKVLDLACGGGHYTRLLKQRGAVTVVGVDVSAMMIQIAEDEEKRNPIGCSYICSDVADIDIIGEFDLVIGAYLCMNADTKEKMAKFAENIYKNLKCGGRYVGIEKVTCNHPPEATSAYGFSIIEPKVPLNEGDRIRFHFENPDGTTFELFSHYWQEDTYEKAFLNAGFKEFHWVGPLVDSNSQNECPPNYWDTFLRVKGVSGLLAIK